MPKVSCVISTYNRADNFLPKAIESVINQTFKDWELIIVDDCSTDNTEAVVNTYLKDSRIMYAQLGENSGSDTKPKNVGAKMAEGEYLMYLDDDCQLKKKAFEILATHLDENPKVDVAYGDMEIMPGHEEAIKRDFDAQFLMLRNFIDTSVAMMRKACIFAVGGWDETLPRYVDWNLWVRMTKAGFKFVRIPRLVLEYYVHKNTKSARTPTKTYNHPILGTLFEPTFDPSGCYINVGNLGAVSEPRVALFTIHYDRLEYTKKTLKDLKATAGYPYTHFHVDNGSKDGTKEWLEKHALYCNYNTQNQGITAASNGAIAALLTEFPAPFDLIIKIDNDVDFYTHDWLKDIVDMWKKNHMLYISPYVEGLYHNPGGAQRVGYGMIGDEYIEVTKHIGGIFAAISAKAYHSFQWSDKMLHGNQDMEASQAFRAMGYMPCYYPKHIIGHRDGTLGQQNKLPEYFQRRKSEKVTQA